MQSLSSSVALCGQSRVLASWQKRVRVEYLSRFYSHGHVTGWGGTGVLAMCSVLCLKTMGGGC